MDPLLTLYTCTVPYTDSTYIGHADGSPLSTYIYLFIEVYKDLHYSKFILMAVKLFCYQVRKMTCKCRRVASEKVRECMKSGLPLQKEHRMYVKLPSDEDHADAHPVTRVCNMFIIHFGGGMDNNYGLLIVFSHVNT
jgi:hypothetical protein